MKLLFSVLFIIFASISSIFCDFVQDISNKKDVLKIVEDPAEFTLDVNGGGTIMTFNNDQDIFDIQLNIPRSGKDKYQKDEIGFCRAYANLAMFIESEGTYTNVYKEFFDEDDNIIDEDNIPPVLLSYHRSKKNGIVAIDTAYNLISYQVLDPNEDREYHQPVLQFMTSFEHMRPDVQPGDYPYISALIDPKNEQQHTFLFFNDQVIHFDHQAEEGKQFKNVTSSWVPVVKIHRLSIGYANPDENPEHNGQPLIFVAAGINGAYIYQIQSDMSLKLVKFINPQFYQTGKHLDKKLYEFTDVDHFRSEESVYFLDKHYGVIKIDIQPSTSEGVAKVSLDSNFKLDFADGLRLRHYTNGYHQTFIAIKETEGIKYTMEFVRNTEINEYYLNAENEYFDIQLQDVIVSKNFAILLGSNVHKIVYHSIHPDFRTDQMMEVDKFSLSFIPGLIDSEFVVEQEDGGFPKLFLVGITKRRIIYYQIVRYYPHVTCYPYLFKFDNKTTTQLLKEYGYYYELNYLSRNCEEKQNQKGFRNSDYIICNTTQPIVVYLTDSWVDAGSITLIVILFVVGLILFLSCSTWLYCKYKRTEKEHINIQDEIKNLIQKARDRKKGNKNKQQNIKYMAMNENDGDSSLQQTS